jgi:hypothetical protein
VVPTQQVMDAFRDLLRAELTALCVAMQGHVDELFRRQDVTERQLAALLRRLDDRAAGEAQALAARRRKAGPRQRRIGP